MSNVTECRCLSKPIPKPDCNAPRTMPQLCPDTMHNITPPHKGAAALRRTKNGKESQRKIKSRNYQRVGPTPIKASIITVVAALVHNLYAAPMVLCPRRAVWRRPVLGERERDRFPKKRLHNQQQNKLNVPGYIARAWAHYNTFRGAPLPQIMSQSEGNCTNQSPNQAPMRLGRCHSCASPRHPDTMHNITPPHKGAAALRRTKNGKESQRKIKSRNH